MQVSYNTFHSRKVLSLLILIRLIILVADIDFFSTAVVQNACELAEDRMLEVASHVSLQHAFMQVLQWITVELFDTWSDFLYDNVHKLYKRSKKFNKRPNLPPKNSAPQS